MSQHSAAHTHTCRPVQGSSIVWRGAEEPCGAQVISMALGGHLTPAAGFQQAVKWLFFTNELSADLRVGVGWWGGVGADVSVSKVSGVNRTDFNVFLNDSPHLRLVLRFF